MIDEIFPLSTSEHTHSPSQPVELVWWNAFLCGCGSVTQTVVLVLQDPKACMDGAPLSGKSQSRRCMSIWESSITYWSRGWGGFRREHRMPLWAERGISVGEEWLGPRGQRSNAHPALDLGGHSQLDFTWGVTGKMIWNADSQDMPLQIVIP